MNALFRVALIAAMSVASCLAQTGTVTFYSRAITARSEAAVFLPKSQQPFSGSLADGPQRIARFRYGRFATFHLRPGAHSFSVEGPSGSAKQPLVINVEAGGQYCVRLFAKLMNLEVYAQWENEIEKVPCQQAQSEAAHLKPIEIKKVDPAVRAEFDLSTAFPGSSVSLH